MEADRSENNNLVAEFPEVAEKMKRTYKAWEGSVPEPAFGSDWKAKQRNI